MTLVELVVAMGVSIILIAGVGVLLDGGNRAWLRAYKAANDRLNIDAQALTAAFGAAGRFLGRRRRNQNLPGRRHDEG
jgi:hypothetical protein